MRKQRTHWKVGDHAVDSRGHEVRIVTMWSEEGIWFAGVVFADGSPSLEEPFMERRCHDGMVVPRGGSYYDESTWIVERGLRRVKVAA